MKFSILTALSYCMLQQQSHAAFTSLSVSSVTSSPSTSDTNTSLKMAYVPDGFTKESYAKFKANEAKKATAKKNLGGMGPRGFKSRSMQSFQEAMERGEAKHLMPVFNAKQKIARGKLRPEDIPYMQRGGSWDQSDIKGAKKKKWLSSDKDYASGGFKKEQSVSIFGYGDGLDWTGKRKKAGPGEVSVKQLEKPSGYKAPNVNDIKKKKNGGAAEEKKNPFKFW